ncbi:hypothetical protein LTR37_006349 [Vermiconidia calcicola]|uniref:Uncharacterized protein n=1 Tax=Vermiconidia calcicola TaxID=1690605 RepID=A0ACC3NI13_9PEZI|nr:hypothetical protein LTR37_006349 [Vermiconidia calcicola]
MKTKNKRKFEDEVHEVYAKTKKPANKIKEQKRLLAVYRSENWRLRALVGDLRKQQLAKGIPHVIVREANVADANVIISEMRVECMDFTRVLIGELENIGNQNTIVELVKGLMTVAYDLLIKIMPIGLYPYEQTILPPIATAMA